MVNKAAQTVLLSRNLAEFVKGAWPEVEGARPLAWNWHLEAVCRNLQALADGSLASRRLIVNVPPRTSKSTLVTIMLPCWLWTQFPNLQFMFASYNFSLSRDHAYKRRHILESAWYQDRWGIGGTGTVHFSEDRQNIVEMENRAGGLMYTTSCPNGATTGRGGDWLLLDDPNDATQMESEVQRASVLRWVDLNWSTRANDPNSVREVVIQQRTHTEDVTGHLLKAGGWRHVKIPMEYNKSNQIALPIGVDPRTTDGELLDATRFPRAYIDLQRKTLGSYGYAGQYDQEPYPIGGGIFKTSWFKPWSDSDKIAGHIMCMDGMYHIDPMRHYRFCTVDPATSEKEIGDKKVSDPDYTVIAAWMAFFTPQGPLLFLMDLLRERMEGPDILPKIAALHRHWRFSIIGIETVGFQLALFQQARRHPYNLPVREISTKNDDTVVYRIDKDKVARAMAATPMMSSGRFFIPDYKPWVAEYLSEMCAFPNAAHDDTVDVTAAGVAIAEKHTGPGLIENNRDRPVRALSQDESMMRDRRLQDAPGDPMDRFYGTKPPGL